VSMLMSPILGPPHLHQRPPEMSHFLGDVSPQGEPERYLQAVRSLYAWYCQHSGGMGHQRWPPLVVNTHGWIQVRTLPPNWLLCMGDPPNHTTKSGLVCVAARTGH